MISFCLKCDLILTVVNIRGIHFQSEKSRVRPTITLLDSKQDTDNLRVHGIWEVSLYKNIYDRTRPGDFCNIGYPS